MGYQPIDSYGMIGDLSTIALVSHEASIDFLCFPHYDSPTVFAAMLDDTKGGRFSIAPAGQGWRNQQLYIPETNVLLTQFLSEDGIGEVTDFMPVGDGSHTRRVVRRVQTLKGSMRFALRCEPRFDYARSSHDTTLTDGAAVFTPAGPEAAARLRSLNPSVPLVLEDGAITAEFTLGPNEAADFVFEMAEDDALPGEAELDVDASLAEALSFWRGWVRGGRFPSRWRETVVRSALTMKMLCSTATGGIAAAATFGLPEEVGGERNWDYRFTWIRDASLTATALTTLGLTDEMASYISWIEDRYLDSDESGALQIMYGIDGRKDLKEQTLDDLEGYRGSAPVRIGNGAYDQLQIDIYGELLLAVDAYDRRCRPVSHALWSQVTHSVNWTCNNWRRKDEGVWEVRGGPQEFLYSRLMSWVAVDRGIRIAQRRGLPAPVENWRRVRDEIYHEVFERYWNEELQAFVQSRDGDTLDAACLLMPLAGMIGPTDPKWLSTLDAIGNSLVEGSFVYRYRTADAASDGLSGAEGTFTMCSFWYVECLARAGRIDEARLFFEKLQGFSSPLGLYSEELSAGGVALGNYPQNFTHLGLVHAALVLDEALDARGNPAASDGTAR
jgi:GH15 family glucan-1,4-alpha-glucosidase